MSAPSRAREVWAMALIGLTSFLLFADQNLMGPNLTQIATEFGLSAVERDQKLGGHVSLGFWIVGGLMSLSVGYLTDRVNRRNLFVFNLLLGEIPCLLTGFARNYEELLLLRTLTGIGIGGAIPLLYSLIGDLFEAGQRARATAIIGFAMGAGIAVGQLLAGFVGPEHGWRLPFILVATPNFVLAFVFLFTVDEPVRGSREAALQGVVAEHGGGRVSWEDYKQVFRVPTRALVFLQGIPGTVPWGVFFTFLVDYYAQDKGYSVPTATLLVTGIGGAAILGGLLGGLIGNRLYNKNPAWLPLWCGATTLLGIVPTAALLAFPAHTGGGEPNITTPLVLGVLTGLTVAVTGSNVKAILLNVTEPETRGAVFSLYNLADDLGRGLGPFIIGFLVAWFGRDLAFQIATSFWLFCGVILLFMARTFPRDEAALQARLAARVAG